MKVDAFGNVTDDNGKPTVVCAYGREIKVGDTITPQIMRAIVTLMNQNTRLLEGKIA